MINNSFLNNFLKISSMETILALLLLLLAVLAMKNLKKRKVSFSKRMLIGLLMGLVIGLFFEFLIRTRSIYDNDKMVEITRQEIGLWYSLLGSSFVKLIQLMAVPVVLLSIYFVILDFEGKNLRKFTLKSLAVLLGTTAIAAMVGIVTGKLFGLDQANFAQQISEAKASQIENISAQSFPQFFLGIVPNNIFSSLSNNGAIISVVIISVLFANASKFLLKKKKEKIEPFIVALEGLKEIVNSVLINIIKIMPYAVIALVANSIVSNGLESILGMLEFILAIYVAIAIMLLVYVLILLALGLNPISFYKKAMPTMVFAFSSRSSVGSLPYTMDTLENKLGVSEKTSKFLAPLSTTIGMNGCAGVFPAMLATIVGGAAGVLDFQFYLLIVIVVTLGSIGIAGVPGTSTVAATVTLNGIGLGNYFDKIGAVFGIDPIIDMGRTLLNVAGGMVSAIVVDSWEKTLDRDKYNSKE